MIVDYSEHILLRMEERGISKEEIEGIISKEVIEENILIKRNE